VLFPWSPTPTNTYDSPIKNLLVVHKPPEMEWSVKICDFGISKRADDQVRAYQTVGIGTPKYMAPEVGLDEPRRKDQKLSKTSYTVKADMWSLGSICVRLITGDSAFHDTELFRYYHDQGPFTPDGKLATKGASQGCRDFVQAVMARDPEHRLSAEQASKHGWFTLNKLQRPRTPTVGLV
jgi:p21-activated kinase 1